MLRQHYFFQLPQPSIRIKIVILILTFLLPGCTPWQKEKKYVVGLSQCMLDDAWRQTMLKEVGIEASNYDHLEVVIRNADTNNKQQIEQIRELINLPVDVLIISPNESEALTPVAEEAFQKGIPTIITDRKINSDLYTTFIGASNYEIGQDAGRHAAGILPPNAVVLEIWGLESSSPAHERHEGFVNALSGRPDVSFIKLSGEWRYDTTAMRITRMNLPERIDLIYAHNDMMAIAAREYFVKQDSVTGKQKYIIGVDAVPGAGLEAVSDDRIDVSFMYPTGGEEVIRAAMQILNGEPIDKYIPLQTAEVNPSIARTLLLQSGQLQSYQQRIEGQIKRLDTLYGRFRFVQNSLGIISFLMIGFVVLTIYVFHINKKIRQTNRALQETNRKEEEQRKKLIALNTEIKEVTAQKLQFFTNISHEVRTPLTLILAPLDRLTGLMYDSPHLSDLLLIRKNADRLLRVINQMLDFRKIENRQEKLKLRESDIALFIREVMSYFDSMAAVRHIHYTFVSDIKKSCMLWIDTDMMEKVLVNLLSNAFKFTPGNGMIRVCLQEEDDTVFIRVEDNGTGIQAPHIPYLFDRFYTEDPGTGTGIGLHLAAEYIRMHQGEITVESIPNKQTLFTIRLRKGKKHLDGQEMIELPAPDIFYEAPDLDNTEMNTMLSITYPYTILIVEDDEEVRTYLERELKGHFTIFIACNGKEALSVLDNTEISLILSDVMMPEMNGFELCRTVKQNVSYNHIPLILLTALTDERQRLFGVSRGADGYIQKPFQINYVIIKIIRLLEERKRFREQLLNKLQENHLLITEPEKAENIDDLFLRRFLAQIDQIYADPQYNVERLSDALGMSRGHLHRKIKELTDTTPVDFLRNYRLKKAAVLLRQHQLTVSEVAYQTGFSSPAYFTKCFKTVYGTTPTEYPNSPAIPDLP